jgi:hypothetical protein
MATLVTMMWRAAALDSDLYDEVEADPRLGRDALLVVLLFCAAGGVGAGWPHPGAVALGAAALFAGWIAWAAMSNWLGTRYFPEPGTACDFREMLRTIGFAASPGLLAVLAVIPEMRVAAFALTTLWMLAATVLAVREALGYVSTGRALLVCGVGWLLQVAAIVMLLTYLVAAARPAL